MKLQISHSCILFIYSFFFRLHANHMSSICVEKKKIHVVAKQNHQRHLAASKESRCQQRLHQAQGRLSILWLDPSSKTKVTKSGKESKGAPKRQTLRILRRPPIYLSLKTSLIGPNNFPPKNKPLIGHKHFPPKNNPNKGREVPNKSLPLTKLSIGMTCPKALNIISEKGTKLARHWLKGGALSIKRRRRACFIYKLIIFSIKPWDPKKLALKPWPDMFKEWIVFINLLILIRMVKVIISDSWSKESKFTQIRH